MTRNELTDQPRGENGHGLGEFSERHRLPAEPQVAAALSTPYVTFPSGTRRTLSADGVHDLVWSLDAVMRWDGVLGRDNTVTRTINRRQPSVGEVTSVASHDQVITVHFRGEPEASPDVEVLTEVQAIILADRLEEKFGVLPEAEYYEYLEYWDDLNAASEQL